MKIVQYKETKLLFTVRHHRNRNGSLLGATPSVQSTTKEALVWQEILTNEKVQTNPVEKVGVPSSIINLREQTLQVKKRTGYSFPDWLAR